MISVSYLFEYTNIPMGRGMGMGMGRGMGVARKVNAPMFAWKILYNKEPPFIPGRSVSHEQVNWKGIGIDKEIPISALNELDKIKDIELRSSCQGSDEDHPTFVIFRTINQEPEYVKMFVSKLNKHKDIKAGYDKGMQGRYRIGVTSKLWYDLNPTKFKKWWNDLPTIIKKEL
jgi:hypothetical protein